MNYQNKPEEDGGVSNSKIWLISGGVTVVVLALLAGVVFITWKTNGLALVVAVVVAAACFLILVLFSVVEAFVEEWLLRKRKDRR